jgi:hypothetical protein
MKTKLTIILALVALVTLSFTFASNNKQVAVKKSAETTQQANDEPAGGFVSEDKF